MVDFGSTLKKYLNAYDESITIEGNKRWFVQKNDATTIEFGFKERVLQYYFLNRGKVHSYAGAFVAIAVLCITYLNSTPSAAEANRAKTLFEQWKQTPSNQKLYKEMRLSVKKIPGLERSLEAQTAQILLSDGQFDAAEVLAKSSLNRLRKESPIHAAFGSTSILIEKKEYQKALEASVALKEEMERMSDNKSTIYACNLLRIAFLQKQVCNAPGELCAWEEVKTLMEMQGNSNAAQFLRNNFDEKSFSLTDFISQREKSIMR